MKKLSKTKQQFIDNNGWDMKNFISQLKELFDDEEFNNSVEFSIGRGAFYIKPKSYENCFCGEYLRFYTKLRGVDSHGIVVMDQNGYDVTVFKDTCSATEIKESVLKHFNRWQRVK
jgi:hypothetical protein